ncbi:hypothetical protein [Leptolyngbya sp. 7M]|uniref:hypothetical protein n=1 Tax=Leptolyngbya sp. 7M TaxID=2812896 RepID=UPI001B8C7C00|nr:hypothetical protein [Leptolyngbya sp. 7M]QYO64462.1 hypothetical protein JVX88_33085 [Leptolyngbya sp. 7M]
MFRTADFHQHIVIATEPLELGAEDLLGHHVGLLCHPLHQGGRSEADQSLAANICFFRQGVSSCPVCLSV